MKKAVIFLLSATLILSGCGKKDNKNNKSDTDTAIEDSSFVGEADTGIGDTDEGVSTSTDTDEPLILPTIAKTDEEIAKLGGEKIGYGCGNDVDGENRPNGAVMMQEQYGQYDAYFISDPENTIYLTFDEGYENGYTEKILDILKQKSAKATFFVTYDYVSKNGELIKRMINEGHTVGNHSWSHPSMPDLSVSEMKDEIKKLTDYVKEKFGYEMKTFRPPMGEFSEKSLAAAQSLGYKSVFWSFAYKDWVVDAQPEAVDAYEKITKKTHKGAIYLLHAVSSTNTAVLGDVIDYWYKNGYTVKAFS